MTSKRGWVGLAWVLIGVGLAAACSSDEQSKHVPANRAGSGGEPESDVGGSSTIAGGAGGGMVTSAGAGVGGETVGVSGGAGGQATAQGGQGGEPAVTGGAGGEVTASAGSAGADDSGGAGGGGSDYVPGLCQEDVEPIEPTVLPSCAVENDDSSCIQCVKTELCNEYRACFGTEPATACSRGPEEQSAGQFECIVACFAEGAVTALDPDELLFDCAAQCSQCSSGLLNDETAALIAEANDPQTCEGQCFPFD